jgi:tetraprenyl-beta-curcumene synthase
MPHAAVDNPVPLTLAQIRALAFATGRELTWGLGETSNEIARWRALAAAIPDDPIRHDALTALAHKRGHADGAALFSVLPDKRDLCLLRLLVGYETILDFLDNVSERHPTEVNGRELHLALSDALDAEAPPADYYRHHPWRDDGGYLLALVEFCRHWVRRLPSYDRVRHLAIREARRTQVLALNHLPDPAQRDEALRAWVAEEHPDERRLEWFELTGLASSSVQVLALLALASKSAIRGEEIERTWATYWPWMGMIAVMLDSYADQDEDAASGDHSYVAHYDDREQMVQRLGHAIAEAARGSLGLPDGHRHAVILGCMTALYLSKDSALTARHKATTRRLAKAGGSLTRLLLPVLRAWRLAYSQRAT